MNDVAWIFVAKGARVFVFGLVSVITPVYLATLGFSSLFVGVGMAAMIGGSAFSNLVLVRYERRIGRRRFLLIFGSLMLVSGAILFSTSLFPLILVAYFLGNVSTTGTEAGPFQSVEAGVLPALVSPERRNRSFGAYNMIGYSAASVGALAASAPAYFQDSLPVFHLLYLLYGFVGLFLVVVYWHLHSLDASLQRSRGVAEQKLSEGAKFDIKRLSALFSIDAFGGGLVSQSLLVYWFFLVYGVSLGGLGIIFLVVNIITAASTLGASYLADRIGNLRTMVSTHLLSNAFLMLIPLVGSLPGALLFLFARQGVSQMDVPTRQAFMTEIFSREESVSAFATTNTARIVSNVPGPPLSGALLGAGLVGAPILVAGLTKTVYDVLVFAAYRHRAR